MSDELLRGGRYQIVGTLGEGSQGTTFDAIDRQEGRAVAIKRFSVRGARSWKDVELAEREATVLESLSHPSLPAHVDHFEENGVLYLVMEKIEGTSLAAAVARGGSLSREDVVRFLRDAATVLEYLHGRSPPLIHRDVNPRNVIRRPDGSFVLVDFGAVRDRLKPEGGSTVVGTFGYMAPEQFQGRALPQTDIYAVGATALRLLTGLEPDKLPHRGLAIDVPKALPGFPSVFVDVFSKMLDPDPDRRATRLPPLVDRLEREIGNARRSEPRERYETREARASQGRSRSEKERDASSSERNERWKSPQGDARHSYNYSYDWSWRDEKRAARAEARRHREEWYRWRRELREAKRAQRRGRQLNHARRPLHGPPLAIALLAISLAMMVVGVVLGVFVPTVLMVLSIVFGPSLREAARNVRDAGRDARESMSRFRGYLLYGPPAASATEGRTRVDSETVDDASRVRVDSDERRPERHRVEPDDEDVIDTTGSDVTDESRRAR